MSVLEHNVSESTIQWITGAPNQCVEGIVAISSLCDEALRLRHCSLYFDSYFQLQLKHKLRLTFFNNQLLNFLLVTLNLKQIYLV
jgi:hypothetical protein